MNRALPASVRLPLIAILVLVALVYAVALRGPFQFDDYATVAVDPGAQSFSAWWAGVGDHVRPLTKLSFVITHSLGQSLESPVLGHRLGNLLIHLLAVALSYSLGYRLLRNARPALAERDAAIAALAAAAVLGLHPLATEAVSYISGRSMALGTLLAMTSLWCYMRWRATLARRWLILALTSCAAAMLARETAFIIPLLWVVWEIVRQHGASPSCSAQRRLAPWSAAVGTTGIVALFAAWLVLHDRYAPLLDVSRQIALGQFAEASFALAMQYFAACFFLLRYPSIDPDVVPSLMPLVGRLIVVIALGVLMLVAWRARRRRPHLLIGVLWMLLWLAPLYVVPVRFDALAERHFYPAIWGAALVLSTEATQLSRRFAGKRWLIGTLSTMVFAPLIVVTLTRVADYRSEVALWEAAYRSAPNKGRVLNNLGYAYMEAGRWDEARGVLSRAVQLDPSDALAQDNLLTAEEGEFGPVRWKRRTD